MAANNPVTPIAASSEYRGPRDVGRAESLYRSALTKPDMDYSSQLLFSALNANPEHTGAFHAILEKIPQYAAARRKMLIPITDSLRNAPADPFIKALAHYCASPSAELALLAATEAHAAGLFQPAITLGQRILDQFATGEKPLKSSATARLTDLLESAGALDQAIEMATLATRLFPDDQAFREREKNLLASRYLQQTHLEEEGDFRKNLHNAAQQETLHRPLDQNARLDALEQRYRQTHHLEDFRELVRALREASPPRREAALPTLEDGHERFGDRETLWFIREVRLESRLGELRLHQKAVDENPNDAELAREHESFRQQVIAEQIDHLYEVVSSLPNTPERQKRELELASRLFDAGRYEEAIKQAQAVKRRGENRLDAWVVMARSFVEMGLIPEATECFQNILTELANLPQGNVERVLDAKYSYAQFLVQQAEKSNDPAIARQARKLCSDVMLEDINFSDIRKLAARLEPLLRR